MKALILGANGPAHALVWKLFNSDRLDHIVSSPGNGGAGILAPIVAAKETVAATVQWAYEESFRLIVPATPEPLQEGLVEEATSMRIAAWGPPKQSALLTKSRLWAKEFLNRYQLPTAPGKAFGDFATAERYLASQSLPVLLWGDYPSEFDGAYMDRAAVMKALAGIFALPPRPDHFRGVVIEAPVVGPSVSCSCITDGATALPLLPVRIYERLEDGDRGWAAPGMGGHTSPSPLLAKIGDYIQRQILQPLLAALQRENLPWWGVLGVDCVIASDGPKVTQIRCTLGDPEAQVLLPRLEDDLFSLIVATNNRNLQSLPPLRWKPGASVGVGLVAQGYPHNFPTGLALNGVSDLEAGVLAFQSETTNPFSMNYVPDSHELLGGGYGGGYGGSLITGFADSLSSAMLVRESGPTRLTTHGGKPVLVVAQGQTLAEARQRAYANLERLTLRPSFHRTDIGAQDL
ncbi:MAG TPA: phosphoribosylglycinamide synthetase C domain-containing protein [Herpetosiphonaceae bacterium]